MTVYVDDSIIPATVGRRRSPWSHLFADSQKELHAFAQRLRLRRESFQPGEPLGGKPFRHYDVTVGERAQAIRLGATPVMWRNGAAGLRQRPSALAEPGPELS